MSEEWSPSLEWNTVEGRRQTGSLGHFRDPVRSPGSGQRAPWSHCIWLQWEERNLQANLVHVIAMPMARANRHSNFSIHLKYKFRNKLAAPERFYLILKGLRFLCLKQKDKRSANFFAHWTAFPFVPWKDSLISTSCPLTNHFSVQYIFLRCCVFIIGEDPDAGKDGRQEEKGMIEDEMVGWHHQLHGPEFEQTSGDDKGPGSVGCCSPWGGKESDTTERLNNNVFMKYTTFLTHANALSMSLTYKLFYRLGFKGATEYIWSQPFFLLRQKSRQVPDAHRGRGTWLCRVSISNDMS